MKRDAGTVQFMNRSKCRLVSLRQDMHFDIKQGPPLERVWFV